MAKFAVAAKALRGPFKKLIQKLVVTVKKLAIKKPGTRTGPPSSAVENAAKTSSAAVERTLKDPATLRGATPDEARRLVPEGWIEKPLRKGDGVRFLNPKRKGESIEIEDGWPGHGDPLHRGPYIKVSRNGVVDRIPLQGNPTLGD